MGLGLCPLRVPQFQPETRSRVGISEVLQTSDMQPSLEDNSCGWVVQAKYLDLSCSEAKIWGVVPEVNKLGREGGSHNVIKRQIPRSG